MEAIKASKMTNSQLSVALIVVNLFLIIIFSKIGNGTNDPDGLLTYFYFIGGSIVLLGGFAFTYHGKQYRWAKWLFGVSIIAGAICVAFIMYITAMAGAFQH
ncbi:hypothetical protein [Flavobacterium tegetincola]|uniref:hypothetical protein n=1 Tax=Flavobacterium tegetincola TaxID=150172 RepID=UPI0003FB9307|nr:hypothetical protein [Flavobacterium tegetincola]